MTIRNTIIKVMNEVFSKENDGQVMKNIDDEDILLDLGIDSLAYATVILQLEEDLNFVPFTLAKEAYYPQKFGELVRFYEENQPK